MTDFYIQVRRNRAPNSQATLYEVVNVYPSDARIGIPSPESKLATIKINNLPATQSRKKLSNLVKNTSTFDYESLPLPYKTDFENTGYVEIPFGVSVSLFYSSTLGRVMEAQDFD